MVSKGTGNRTEKSLRIGRPLVVRCSTAVFEKDVQSKGFALVISLTLMSFVLMLLLSLSLLVQVELQSAQVSLKRLIAKENARLGLMIGIGDLQRYVGPDQRVTARADILGEGNFNIKKSKWTGVWDEKQTFISWLGSGIDPITVDPTSSNNAVKLVGVTTAGNDSTQHVWAPFEEVNGASGSSGSYAYYVSDESLKASIGKQDVIASALEDPTILGLTDTEMKHLAQANAGRPRTELIFPKLQKLLADDRTKDVWNNSSNEDSIASLIDKSSTIRDLGHIDDLDLDFAERLGPHYHDLTFLSKGLLVDTKRGGLKLDLSAETVSDPFSPFDLNESFFNFINSRVNNEDHAIFCGAKTGPEIGAPINTTPLVLTEFCLYMGVYRTGRYDNTLEVSLAIRADVWNPFATNLGFTPKNVDDFQFSIEGLPLINVTWETGRGTSSSNTGSFDLDLSTLKFTNSDSGAGPYDLSEMPYDIYDKMSVGEVRTVVERFTAPIPNIEVIDESNRSLSSDDFITLEAPEAIISIKLSEIPTNSSTSERIVQKFDNIEYYPLFTEDHKDYNLIARAKPSYNSDFQAVYHFKFEDDMMLGDLEKWASELDPRSILMDFSTGKVEDLIYVNEDPGFAVFVSTKFMNRPEFFYGGSGSRRRNYHRFFDYPARPLTSVGFLQHLSFYQDPPYSIGNPWGGIKNAAFDRYFFSGYEKGYEARTHMNPHLGVVDQNNSVDPNVGEIAAARYEVNGAFNLNSTSVEAWKAALSGINLYDWKYRLYEDSTRAPEIKRSFVQNAVFRFPHHADRTYTHPYTDNLYNYPEISQSQRENWYRKKWQPDWAAAFTTGMRELRGGYSDNDPIDDISELAEAIVRLLKERGEPYVSIEELLTLSVDSSAATRPLLQEAIDLTRINTVSQSNYKNAEKLQSFPRYAPSFVTQADLINVLAPYSQVRGDTFVIRSAGRATGIIEDSSSNIYCDALVQRKVSPVNDSTNMDPSETGFLADNLKLLNLDG